MKTVRGRISLNYKRHGRFTEAADLSCFSPRKSTRDHRETRQRSLIFHRGDRFYRGSPRLARPDSSCSVEIRRDTESVSEDTILEKQGKQRKT